MPQTLTGWILFAIIIVSGCASIVTAMKLIISGFGKAFQDRRDFHAACIFGLLLVVATALFIWIEPMPI
ncbi:hypothetical protein [Methylobacterium sp. J-070]|uniref:hypothetical protein n=1 Tax=Methylobacterium sp. J-070 TaxID=2836650 RepID=UPI001FBBAEAC|nr:hypothetical protein [Methylobacterium sp. J-070]MCJ2049418.1 hypothetical protein [Methylobacterium sp. J-070]